MYICVGVVVVSCWGWNVLDPVMLGTAGAGATLWPSTWASSRALNAFWFVCMSLSGGAYMLLIALTHERMSARARTHKAVAQMMVAHAHSRPIPCKVCGKYHLVCA